MELKYQKLKIAIFAHDAGGSDMLIELLKANLHVENFKIYCTNDSVCAKLVKSKNLINYFESIECDRRSIFVKLDLFKPDLILYGTGWQNHLEYYFLDYARRNSIPSVTFLDNWTNFRERFGFPDNNWEKNIADFVAVHDEHSRKIANSFGFKNIVTIKNYALEKQLNECKKINLKEENITLFLSEPTAKVAKKTYQDSYYWGFNERDVYKAVLKHKSRFACKDIVVRLHPSDKPDIYKQIDPKTTISSDTLAQDISRAKVIIGLDSSVLHLAFLLGKKVISYLPSKKRDFHVPLPKENQIRDLEKLNIDDIKRYKNSEVDFGIEFALFVKNILG